MHCSLQLRDLHPMGKITVKALPANKAGNSLAIWLAANHPDLFVTLYKQTQAMKNAKKARLNGIRGLSQDDSAGVTTTFDTPDLSDSIGTTTTFDSSALSSSFTPLSESDLQPISIDESSLDSLSPNLLTDSNSSGLATIANLGGTPTSSGQTVAGATGSQTSSGFLSALGAVGSFVGSKAGSNALLNLATAVIGANTPQAQTIQTQVARTTANQTVAPITYTRDAAGNLVPVYATQSPSGTVYQPLTPQGIAALSPSNIQVLLTRYGPYIFVGSLVFVAFTIFRK